MKNTHEEILTDAKGRPIAKPQKADFATVSEYVRAVHDYNDRVAYLANSAFGSRFVEVLRRGVK